VRQARHRHAGRDRDGAGADVVEVCDPAGHVVAEAGEGVVVLGEGLVQGSGRGLALVRPGPDAVGQLRVLGHHRLGFQDVRGGAAGGRAAGSQVGGDRCQGGEGFGALGFGGCGDLGGGGGVGGLRAVGAAGTAGAAGGRDVRRLRQRRGHARDRTRDRGRADADALEDVGGFVLVLVL
jgi:hypothetical protein